MSPHRTVRLAILALIVLAPAALADNPFDVGGKTAQRAIVTVGEAEPPDSTPSSPMLDQLRGILARIDRPHIIELRAAGGNAEPIPLPPKSTRLCIIHLNSAKDTREVEILRDPGGAYYAQDRQTTHNAGDPKPLATKLNQPRFAKLVASWPAYRGDYTLPEKSPKPGEVNELPGPYTPGWFTVDQAFLSDRFNGGHLTSLDAPARDLDSEPLLIRLPKNYDPRTPCGLLVYIDPGERASIYQPFHPAADDMNFIIVAATNTGNDVHRAIRYQLALDGVASVSQRYLIDPRRVYVTGISGGGQISTHLWLCMPDVFTAAIPIVALGSYKNIPAGNAKVWLATFAKPESTLFHMAMPHRCGVMTGAQDFNERPINGAAAVLVEDGLKVKVYDYPDMAHGAPTAERFAEVLKWVDEPYDTLRAKETKSAKDALDRIKNTPGLKGKARDQALVEVTRLGPWTPAAWEAAELLGAATAAPTPSSP